MNTSLVDKYVIEVLKKHGWYEGRKFNPDFWISQLTQEGYNCFNYAMEILHEFGDIEINVGSFNGYMSAQFDFNPYNAASGEYDRIERFENAAQEKLFPIGNMVQAIAYVGDKQNIYYGDWRTFFWVGKNIEDYLNQLFLPNSNKIQII